MKRIILMSFAILGFSLLNAQSVTYSDNFSTDHDYMTGGVEGTIWKGMNVNTSENENNICILTEFKAVNGGLRIVAENGIISGEDVCGPYLYRIVREGVDFEAELKVTGGSFASFDSSAFHNSVGIFARDVDHVSNNHVYAHFFELWGFHHILKSSIEGVQTEVDVAKGALTLFPTLTQYPFMKLTRVGNLFSVFVSPDGFTWTATSFVERPELEGVDLEVGIAQGNYTDGMVGAVTDNFKLTHVDQTIAVNNANVGNFKVYSSNGKVIIESTAKDLITSSRIYSIDGREVASKNVVKDNRCEFSNLKAGLYVTVVTMNGVQTAKKVIVK